MEDFSLQEMREIQCQLQEKYKDKWNPLSPEQGKDQLLWMMIELGEAADIMKKEGVRKIMDDRDTRAHFIEEMADALMYYNDILLCYGISIEEFKSIYLEKHKRNMKRW
ncbi:MAG: nucleotide pyrophosphohydrolase [Lachnospiraceae bacterium]|nr:nucleotide pyrophosphohydrolase [uncultured Acetatifactor sp.]MCI8541786.1 nucleotide pyrophosphohydrolase [Lachnospiraceae bacterium]